MLSDVLDGSEYQKHLDFVAEPANFTLLLNTDGVNVFQVLFHEPLAHLAGSE